MKVRFEKKIIFEGAHVLPRKYKNLHNLPHWHREHELLLVESGEITLTDADHSFSLSSGNAAFLHSEEIHSITSSTDAVVTVLKLDPTYFRRIVGEKRLLSPVLCFDHDLPARLSELFCELKTSLEYSGIVADCIAVTLLAHIFRQEETRLCGTDRAETDGRYRELLELIGRDFAYITFDDAVEYMHFSRPYFSRFFYTRTGMTFSRYLNTIRISAAVERVLEGRMSATEISKSCGFNTIRNFNRVFKELTGYTPRSLPTGYTFTKGLREYTDSGFDPTQSDSELLDP